MSWLRPFLQRPRFLLTIAAGVVLFFVMPAQWVLTTRILIAWNVASGLYLALAWVMMARADVSALQARADQEDERASVILLLIVVGTTASFAAITVDLQDGSGAEAFSRGFRLALAGSTILCSWLILHTTFALHYAHGFYSGSDDQDRRGLEFPGGDRDPDYWDFMYFSFTMGAASQTSDVAVTDHRTRRLVLAHTILAFLFNATVLALAVNVGASLIGTK